MRRWIAAALGLTLAVGIWAAPAAAGPVEDALANGDRVTAVLVTDHTPDEYLATFDGAELDGLGTIGAPPVIMGDAALDARIRAIGEARGYRRRAEPSRSMVHVDGQPLQPEAAAAWQSLKAAAAAAGHGITLISGQRTVAQQVHIFRRQLTGTSDSAIDQRLRTVAVPGYSKHHSGYAIDIRTAGASGFLLPSSPEYQWLAANNFRNAKAHGWIPSYPFGSGPAGPEPEPWEFVWVGATEIICGDFDPSATVPYCDSVGSAFETDIAWLHSTGVTNGCRTGRFCPERTLTRWEAAAMLWRLSGEPAPAPEPFPFTDVVDQTFFRTPVQWLVQQGITNGATPTEFAPERPLTRAEFVTMVWRLAGEPEPGPTAPTFVDVAATSFAGTSVSWAAESGITRGVNATEFVPDATTNRSQVAAFLHRYAVATGA